MVSKEIPRLIRSRRNFASLTHQIEPNDAHGFVYLPAIAPDRAMLLA